MYNMHPNRYPVMFFKKTMQRALDPVKKTLFDSAQVFQDTGLLPHVNGGVMTENDILR